MTAVFDIGKLVRRDLDKLIPYDVHYKPGVIRMDANENPYDFPTEVKEYIFSAVKPELFSRYPDPMSWDLIVELSAQFSLEKERIMVGCGSDELILYIMTAFGPGKKVVIASPTFSMYGIHAMVAGAIPVNVPRKSDFAVDMPAMIEAAGEEPGIMILCNPNNPSGNATPVDDIAALAGSVQSLLVVDEAYIEFGGETCLPLLARYPNLVILRTFSKAFGLAGLRVGYLFADPAVVAALMKIKQPFNLNSFTQLAAISTFRFKDLFADRVKKIISGKKNLEAGLREIPGVHVFPSEANYLMFTTGFPADEVYRLMLEEGVLIRYFNLLGRGKFLRVSVGTERENEIFIEKLRKILF